uniref:EOG090X0B17 n=1 Tax=Evadne anonyx TaxID=141404 RepID=A0A9N6WQC0_9CRUS|nr:EOG090X0B17 [Evadne anonyx]
MATHFIRVLVAVLLIGSIVCPPVDKKKPAETKDPNAVPNNEIEETGIEYNRYLQEVVQLLESDSDFRQKLEKSDPEDIRNGKVAKELEFVNHHVRNKLDELKRQEMERLRHLAVRDYENSKGSGIPHDGRLKLPGHLDHKSPSFETEDLRKLIVQTTKDLEELDRKRKEEFKEYEMQKEFEHETKLKTMDEEHRKTEEQAWEESQKKHKQHPQMHHPGGKQQLEEVWEQQDHLSPESFDPKTFFVLHDLDGNGFWDANEVKALFSKELDKVYDPNAPEDDMAERYEEMERMREHVVNETDVNGDHLISFPEFWAQTRKQDFDQDQGWNSIDEQPVYSQQEYAEFEHRRQIEIQQMIDQGLLPPHPPGMPLNAPHGMPPPVDHQKKQMTAEEGAKLEQHYAANGQPQFVPQQHAQQAPRQLPKQVPHKPPQEPPKKSFS